MATRNYMDRASVPPGEDVTDASHPVHGAARRAELGLNPTRKGGPGPIKTPAPLKPYDFTARDRTFGRASGNPGSNAWGGASSLSPGETTVDVESVKQSQPDETLALLKAKGTGGHGDDMARDGKDNMVNSQLRQLSPGNVADGYGQKNPNKAGEVIPPKVGWIEAQPVRQPAAGNTLNLKGK